MNGAQIPNNGSNLNNVNNMNSSVNSNNVNTSNNISNTPNTNNLDKRALEEQKRRENIAKKQAEFNKYVQKARQDEARRFEEQKKIILEMQKKQLEVNKKEEEKKKKIAEIDAKRQKREEELAKSSSGTKFSDKLKAWYLKASTPKYNELELKAKKAVLDEQFKDDKNNLARLKTPILFKYKAKAPDGKIVTGTMDALSRVDIHSFLTQEGYEVYEIYAVKNSSNINIMSFKFKISKLIFCLSQLSAYLKAGIALADAVKLIENQTKSMKEKRVWRAVYYDLSMGDNLSSALEKRGNAYPKLLINMIKTAEMTGNLPETLDDMIEYYTETETTRKQMISALMYPTIVVIFAIAVIVFMLIYIVPNFAGIFNDLGTDEIPAITVFLLNLSAFLGKYILQITIGVFLVLLMFTLLYKYYKPVRKALQVFAMKIPVIGNIIIYNEVTMFSKTFANLLNHNVFITDSIEVLSLITTNEVYKKLIHDTSINLTKGESVSASFKDHWAFPYIAYQMILTGEKTGRLGQMMEKVSQYYQEQHRTIVNRLKTLIEPILIVGLAVIVGGILLAIVVPMFALYDQVSS